MKINLSLVVAVLLLLTQQQLVFGQNGCYPLGSSTATAQLQAGDILPSLNFEIDNDFRYNKLKENVVFESTSTPFQFSFHNPNAKKLYFGMYLDFNNDAYYDPLTEMVYNGATTGIEFNDVITLTGDQIGTIAENSTWFRIIVSETETSLLNTCTFPALSKVYQVVETQGTKLKIKNSTAENYPSGGCINGTANLHGLYDLSAIGGGSANVYSINIKYFQQTTGSCDGAYLPFSEGLDGLPFMERNNAYQWDTSTPYEVSFEDEEFSTQVDDPCWFPLTGLGVRVVVKYKVFDGEQEGPLRTARDEMVFPEIPLCGGSGQNREIWNENLANQEAQLFPNPSQGSTYLKLGVATNTTFSYDLRTVMGQDVLEGQQMELNRGTHTIPLQTETLSSGTYFLTLTKDGVRQAPLKLVINK